MEELWDLYDINKRKIGKHIKRGMGLKRGEYHLAVDIWVINKNNNILITQRHPQKNFGLLWECSGGAAISEETTLDAAIRELSEETGLRPNLDKFNYIGTHIGENYILDTYLVNMEVEIERLNLQKEEVVSAQIVSPKEFEVMNSNKLIVPSVWDRFDLYKSDLLK